MLIRLILSPADENRSGANQTRQHLSFREHFRRGNALLGSLVMGSLPGIFFGSHLPQVIAPTAPTNERPETTAIPPTSIDPGLRANPNMIEKMSYQRTVFNSGGTGSIPNCSTPLG
jgi:hypothetical protein